MLLQKQLKKRFRKKKLKLSNNSLQKQELKLNLNKLYNPLKRVAMV
jgi:hypothetical protein